MNNNRRNEKLLDDIGEEVEVKLNSNLYYQAPVDKCFDEVKEKSIELWREVDHDNDRFGYASSKINRIKDIKNISDNFMYIFCMFDIFNQSKLIKKLSEKTKEEIRIRLISGGNNIFYLRRIGL
jgi:hypothetical protein